MASLTSNVKCEIFKIFLTTALIENFIFVIHRREDFVEIIKTKLGLDLLRLIWDPAVRLCGKYIPNYLEPPPSRKLKVFKI